MGRTKIKIEKTCLYCGKTFTVYPSGSSRRFCSKECSNKNRMNKRTGIEKDCLVCGKVFYVFPKDKHQKCCSMKCSFILRKKKTPKIKIICNGCGKEFFVTPSHSHTKFCNKKCSHEYRMVERTCEWCGKKFSVKLSRVRKGGGKFCSRNCYSRWQGSDEGRKKMRETILESYASGGRKPNRHFNTSIEVDMENELKKIGLNYTPQYYIKGTGFVDFFLSDYNVIIECDGDYWHNLEEQKKKDVSRDFNAEFLHQYPTLRFWEHEIKESPKECINKIKKFINKREAILE